MIRRLLVPFIAVCAALAAGIALGGGPLSDLGHASTTPSSAKGAGAVVRAQAKAGEKLAAATAGLLYGGKLAGQQVAVITLPGAPAAVSKALAGQVAAAGGSVSSTTAVDASAVAPESKTLVDSLGGQLATQLHGLVDAGQPTYVRLGQLLAGSVATTTPQPTTPSADQGTLRSALSQSKLITGQAPPTMAPLVLLVLGKHVNPTILSGVVQGLATRSHGVVVAASTGSGLRGDLKRLRATRPGPRIATVDGDETATGQLATTLALAHQVAGGGGAYGASGIDGVVPLG
jgi:hypothetical protein